MPFDELIAKSDVLTIHCPGGGANKDLVDAAVIARMKRGAVLVNAARGDIVNEAALVAALESGQISAPASTPSSRSRCRRRAGSPASTTSC